MLYRAIHTYAGKIKIATYVDDSTDLTAEADSYAAQSLLVCPITAAEFPNAVDAVSTDSWYIDYVGIDEVPTMIESPTKPGDYYDFNFTTHTWVVSAERLTQARNDKYVALLNEYTLRSGAPYVNSGMTFSDTNELIARAYGLVSVLEFNTAIPTWWAGWHGDSGGSYTVAATWQLERDFAKSLINTLESFKLECLAARYVHQDALAALATVEDIIAYDITTGWPA